MLFWTMLRRSIEQKWPAQICILNTQLPRPRIINFVHVSLRSFLFCFDIIATRNKCIYRRFAPSLPALFWNSIEQLFSLLHSPSHIPEIFMQSLLTNAYKWRSNIYINTNTINCFKSNGFDTGSPVSIKITATLSANIWSWKTRLSI